MKRILIFAGAAFMAVACTKNGPEADGFGAGRVPVELSADIPADAKTKAAVAGESFPANTSDVFRLTAYAGTAAPAKWDSPYFSNEQVNSGGGSAITLKNSQYYPADGKQKLYFYAYAPAAKALAGGAGTTAPVASYTLTGQEDIMAAQEVSGIGGNDGRQPTLAFTHKLKQVQFRLVADATFLTGVKATSIIVKGAKTSARLNIATGALTFDATPTGNLTAYNNATGVEITTAGVAVPGCVMFEPGATLTVSVTAGGITYPDASVTLTGTNAGQAGVSHLVTLTFKRDKIDPSAVITAWVQGGDVGGSYPYVMKGKYVVSRDLVGSSAGPFHPFWTGATPSHVMQSPDDAIAAQLEVAAENIGFKTWEEAKVACPQGWRLPTRVELMMISRVKSQLSGVATFEDAWYWSATMRADDNNKIELVHFGNNATGNVNKYAREQARCIRDVEEVKDLEDLQFPYVIAGKIVASKNALGSSGGPFHDFWTGATPDHTPTHANNSVASQFAVCGANSNSSPVSWDDAQTLCPSGWRLPTGAEALLMYQYRDKLTSISTLPTVFWTATRMYNDSKALYLSDGTLLEEVKSGLVGQNVRCVRDVRDNMDYPYVTGGKVIVVKDAQGSWNANNWPFHDFWAGATPPSPANDALGYEFEVSESDVEGSIAWTAAAAACAPGWRVPTAREAQVIRMMQSRLTSVAAMNPTAYYWTGTEIDDETAWNINNNDGSMIAMNKSSSRSTRVRCVRDVADVYKFPYVEQGKYIVSKNTFGSSAGPFHDFWIGSTPVHDEASPLNAVAAKLEVAAADLIGPQTWFEGVTGCAPGWRLPTRSELALIYDMKSELSGVGNFAGTWYWSASELVGQDTKVSIRHLGDGGLAFATKTNKWWLVRCVRDVK